MSIWNQAYEDFRRPYLEEKKDRDGDGKVESDSKEHAGLVHNAIQRAKGGKPDGKDTRKEEVETVDEKFSMAAKPEKKAMPRPTKKAENKKGMSMKSRAIKAVGTQRRQDKETGVSEEIATEGNMKQARKNVGASTCWDGYKAKGTKMKNGRQVPNCVKEEEEAAHAAEVELRGEAYTITNSDVRGNTPAYRNYKAGMKSKTTGKPMYQLAPHVKTADSYEPEGEMVEGNKPFSNAGEYPMRDAMRDAGMNDAPYRPRPNPTSAPVKKAAKAKKNLAAGYTPEGETIEEKKGLYANIHAKRKRGESPAKPGDEDYPAKDAFKKAAKTAKKEHYDWREDFDFVIEKKSEDCGCDHTPKKGVKNKITVMPEVKTEEVAIDEGLTGARAQRARQMQDSDTKSKGGRRTDADRDTAFRLGTGTGPGRVSDRRVKSQSDQGKGNAAKRRMKEEPEFAGNYEGPLYAPHPDIKKDQELEEKLSTQYKDKKKMGQSSQRKSLGRGSSIKDGAKPSGYESKKEFRSQEMRNMKEDLAGAVDSVTKRAQGALEKIGVKINRKPRPTATPSAQTQNTMRQNKMSNESVKGIAKELDKAVEMHKSQAKRLRAANVSEGKKKKDDSYLETNFKKRQANNEKARKDMEKVKGQKNPHFEETLLDRVLKTYVSEEDYDRMKDRRMERGGVGGNTDYKRAPKYDKATSEWGKKKPKKGNSSAMDIVKKQITDKYGKGAIIDTKKKKK